MRTKQRGVAIVLAMGVAALAALAASGLMVAQSTWSRQIELAAGHVEARLVLDAGIDWARAILGDDARASTVDHLGEPWALRLPAIPVEHGSLSGHLEDQQGKFNLNNLLSEGQIDPVGLAQLRRLLVSLALPPQLADALADWIDTNPIAPAQDGAEDPAYRRQAAPRLAANQALPDIAELALVRGFDEPVRKRLRPFVSALPRVTAVNVNTASAEVIAAVVDGLPADDARALVAQRQRQHFRDLPDFLDRLPRGLSVAAEDLSVSSDFFLAHLQVRVGESQARGTALLARGRSGWPAIVWKKTL